jgi:hypothetical protein
VRTIHGVAILYDCHSIRSKIPFLFDGTLPDFNIGTNGGDLRPGDRSCGGRNLRRAEGYSSVLNGRFKGGWTTRHYGRPATGMHAIQMELAQSTHLATEEPPWAYDPPSAARLRVHLKTILNSVADLAHWRPIMTESARTPATSIRRPAPNHRQELADRSADADADEQSAPDVAENPHELVVYGGIGRAARTWEDFDRLSPALKELEADETLSCSRASRWRSSAPMPTPRAC